MTAWDGIEEFVAVATAGSFTAGGQAMGMSSTHMSRSIARLEGRVQAQLFQRTTRTVRLTDAGQLFLDHCRRMILERDEAIARISERGEPQGEMRITCSTAMGERFVAPILRRFCQQHPKLSVSIELTNRLVDLVAEGFDFAIRTGQLADSRLIGTRVASRTLYTCAAPSYIERFGKPRRVAELAAHECLSGTAATWSFKVGDRAQMVRPKGRWRCNSGAAVIDAALAGMGICQLPDFYLLPYIASGALIPLLENFSPDSEPIWAVYPQRRHLLPKISQLVDLLRVEIPMAMVAAAQPPHMG